MKEIKVRIYSDRASIKTNYMAHLGLNKFYPISALKFAQTVANEMPDNIESIEINPKI